MMINDFIYFVLGARTAQILNKGMEVINCYLITLLEWVR